MIIAPTAGVFTGEFTFRLLDSLATLFTLMSLPFLNSYVLSIDHISHGPCQHLPPPLSDALHDLERIQNLQRPVHSTIRSRTGRVWDLSPSGHFQCYQFCQWSSTSRKRYGRGWSCCRRAKSVDSGNAGEGRDQRGPVAESIAAVVYRLRLLSSVLCRLYHG